MLDIPGILNRLWDRKTRKLEWLEFEDFMTQILRCKDISDSDKIKACKELLDSFTRRGHFDVSEYFTKI